MALLRASLALRHCFCLENLGLSSTEESHKHRRTVNKTIGREGARDAIGLRYSHTSGAVQQITYPHFQESFATMVENQ